jgi:hypothetical protein
MPKTLQEQLHRIASSLEKIHDQIKSATDQYEANSEKQQLPQKMRAELHIPQAVAEKKDAANARQETRDRKRLWIEGVALAAAILIGYIAIHQWYAMKVDERPWVRVWIDMAPVQTLNPSISGTLHILDSGKTPARKADGTYFIEKVTNGTNPTFPEGRPLHMVLTGTQFPSVQTDAPINFYPLSQTELNDLNAKKIFFVIYGRFTYKDFFGTRHWTKFCQPWMLVSPGYYTFQDCTEYNDIDDN